MDADGKGKFLIFFPSGIKLQPRKGLPSFITGGGGH